MLLYTDIIHEPGSEGDEMFSDAFPIKLVDDIVYEVDCQMIIVGGATEVDIGANPSAEEATETLDDNASRVNNVVHSFRLQPTAFDKKAYLSYLKARPIRVEAFEAGAQKHAKKIIANFKDYEFYTGASMNPEGMVALLNYRADGQTPYFTFWKDGLKEVKL
ncbi:hypothetical protein ID866_6134 [Astraeus odoratus]|nr:hypothetical protein ID866_6134 [Astraeus odoratus]